MNRSRLATAAVEPPERNQPVNASTQLRLRIANERIARDHRQAAEERLADQARRRHRLSLRQRASRQLIQLGERLATEPSLTPVRSR
jgi:hypothetical protein